MTSYPDPPIGELPPLVKDVYDRLALLGLHLERSYLQRANIDFGRNPELLSCSDLLWRISYLTESAGPRPYWSTPIVFCVVGERVLGKAPTVESWDILIRKNQASLIALALEGDSVEEVLGRLLKARASAPGADIFDALAAVNDALLYLNDPALVAALAGRASALLLSEDMEAERPCHVIYQVHRLVYDCRLTQGGLPEWLKRLVVAAYSRCAPLVPSIFEDPCVRPEEAFEALAFLFALEGLALSFGGEQSPLFIIASQTHFAADDRAIADLFWSAPQWRVTLDSIRRLSGAGLIERMQPHFERLQSLGADLVAALRKRATAIVLRELPALAGKTSPRGGRPAPTPDERAARALCLSYPAAMSALSEVVEAHEESTSACP